MTETPTRQPASAEAPGHTDLMVSSESIDKYLDENPPSAPASSDAMLREALTTFLKQWDKLPAGHGYSSRQIQRWLSEFGPAIAAARAALSSAPSPAGDALERAAEALFNAKPHNHPDGHVPVWSAQPQNIKQAFRDKVIAALSSPAAGSDADEQEAYEIGKRDGYEDAIQDLDLETGGDGEFYGSTIPDRGVDVPAMKQRIIERFKAWSALMNLRAGEGHTVTLLCDNPDFNGQPNSAIECCGEWTEWEDRRFTGDTIEQAIQGANLALMACPPGHGNKNFGDPVPRAPAAAGSDGWQRDAALEEAAALCEHEAAENENSRSNVIERSFFEIKAEEGRQLAKSIRALKSAAPTQTDGWQPIETAPRDGTRVDLLFPYPRGRTINCRWTDELEIGWHWMTPAWGPNGLLPESEWTTNTYPNLQPTHWRPLPAAPTPSTASEE